MRDEEEIIFHTVRLPEACRAAVVLSIHDELFQCDIRLPYHHFERSEKSLSFAARDSRFFPPYVPRTSPLSSSVFHTVCTLGAPAPQATPKP